MKLNVNKMFWICGYHSSGYKEFYLLGYNAM